MPVLHGLDPNLETIGEYTFYSWTCPACGELIQRSQQADRDAAKDAHKTECNGPEPFDVKMRRLAGIKPLE